MKQLLLIIFLFLITLPLYAAPFYEWKDENGKWHFTDRLNEVPKKYIDKEKRERFLRWEKEKLKNEKTEKDTKSLMFCTHFVHILE